MLLAVALSFLYRLARRGLALLRIHRMDALSKDAEILVLRHQAGGAAPASAQGALQLV
jgi:hypothetical protein